MIRKNMERIWSYLDKTHNTMLRNASPATKELNGCILDARKSINDVINCMHGVSKYSVCVVNDDGIGAVDMKNVKSIMLRNGDEIEVKDVISTLI